MATIIDLNKAFNKALEDARAPAQGTLLGAQLEKLFTATSSQIDILAKKDNEARGDIMRVLKKKVPTQTELDKIKQGFEERHNELKKHLEKIHAEQYDDVELALEKENTLSPPQRLQLLAELKKAQKVQIEGLDARAEYDSKRLQKAADLDADRDRKFSFYMLDLAERKQKAIGRYYRPPGGESAKKLFGWIKEKLGGQKEDATLGVTGEVEAKRAAEFSTENVEYDLANKKWIAKDTEEILGGRQVKKKGAEYAEEWTAIDTDYFKDKTEIVLTDVPTAGAGKHRGPVALFSAIGLFDTPHIRINLDTQIFADKAKNITAVSGAITCKMFAGATHSQKIEILNILAHAYRAKGWTGVELGYETSENLHEEAYLACRRAGFSHDQIFFHGKLMSKPDIIAKGDDARKMLEEAYDKRASQQDPVKQSEIEDAMLRLAIPITYPDPRLDPQKFFDVEKNEQTRLFKEASLDQRAAIIADYAFDEENLQNYMQTVTAGEKSVMLNAIGETHENWDRAFEAFQGIDKAEQAAVMKTLGEKTAAYIFLRLPENEREPLFKDLSLAKKIAILKNPILTDAVVYSLFKTLDNKTGEFNELMKVLKELAREPQANAKLLAAIVAQSLINESDRKDGELNTLHQLNYILKDFRPREIEAVMTALYDALPEDRRGEKVAAPQQNSNQNEEVELVELVDPQTVQPNKKTFSDMLEEHTSANDLFFSSSWNDLKKFYAAACENKKNLPKKSSYTEINKQKKNLLKEDKCKEAAQFFYGNVDAKEIAKILRESKPENLKTQLEALVSNGEDADHVKLAEIAIALGPNIVGKALAEFDQENAKKLIGIIQNENNHKFLANVLEVYQNAEGDKANLSDVELPKVMPHIHHPALIKALLEGKNDLDELSSLFNTDETPESVRIFKEMSKNQQTAMFDNMNQDVKTSFFKHLHKDIQQEQVDQLAEKLKKEEGQQVSKDKQEAANVLINYWKGKEHFDKSKLEVKSYEQAIKHASSPPTARFLADYLNVPNQNENAVNSCAARFKKIVDGMARFPQNPEKEMGLANLGHAIALITDDSDQASLFKQLPDAQGNEADLIRAHALIHVASCDPARARGLFEALEPKKQEMVEKAVKELLKDFSSPLKEDLETITQTPPRPSPIS